MLRILIVVCAAAVFLSGCAGINSKNRALYKSHIVRGQHYMNAEKYTKSIQEFTEAIKLGEVIKKPMVPTIMLGETYVKSNEIGKARTIAREATKRWPNESSTWELCGKVDLKQTKLKEAEMSFERAIELAKRKKDKTRLNSLMNLTKGLQAYSSANMQSTKEYFANIKDKVLAKDVKVKAKAILGVNVGT